jgi:ribosomal protein L11 methyltransferase
VVKARWLEVSLTVEEELAEAVAEVLSRFAAQGSVALEQAVTYDAAETEGRAYGPVRVFGYLAADEGLEDTRRRLEEALWHLGQIRPLPMPEYRWIEDQDWMETWKAHYHPIPIGERLLVAPPWAEVKPDNRMLVQIDPSMAFGTGTHPSTQLCLQLLERYMQPGQDVIDVGCGSGILSIAAVRLGARRALAVDIDQAAVRATRENAELNGVSQFIEVGLGSVREVLNGSFSLRKAGIVLVNILAPVILRLLDEGLIKLVAPNGVLILAGILQEQAAEVLTAAGKHGLVLLAQVQNEDWVGLALQKA